MKKSLGPLLGSCLSASAALLASPARAEPSSLPPEMGYNYAETETPRATATGGAMRALSNSTTALFVNPANMASSHVYHISALAEIYPEAGRQSYGGAIVDSVVSATGLAGGVGGTWSQQDPEGVGREWLDLRGGLAIPVGDMVFVGAAGRVFSLIQNGWGPLGPSPASGGLAGANIINTFTFDLGATFRPIPELSLAITGHNLTNTGSSFLPLMGGAGIAYAIPEFGIGADVVLDTTTYGEPKLRFMGGAEFLAANMISIRAGYRFDDGQQSHAISTGLGYVDKRFSVDASLRRTVSGPESTAIVFGFTLHIEALSLGMGTVD